MYQVNIKRILDRWVLYTETDNKVIKVIGTGKLIDLINLASQLQMHVSNVAELPLKQYGVVA